MGALDGMFGILGVVDGTSGTDVPMNPMRKTLRVKGRGVALESKEDAIDMTFEGGTGAEGSLAVVDVVATSNVNINSPGFTTYDGQAMTGGSSTILLTAQTAQAENGPYLFNGATVPLTRVIEVSTDADFHRGMQTRANFGTLGVGTIWELSSGTTLAGAKKYSKLTNAVDKINHDKHHATHKYYTPIGGGADDTAALQAMINSLPPGGGIVEIQGNPIIDGSIVVAQREGITIRGSGSGVSGVNGSGLVARGPRTPGRILLNIDRCSRCIVEDLTLYGGPSSVEILLQGSSLAGSDPFQVPFRNITLSGNQSAIVYRTSTSSVTAGLPSGTRTLAPNSPMVLSEIPIGSWIVLMSRDQPIAIGGFVNAATTTTSLVIDAYEVFAPDMLAGGGSVLSSTAWDILRPVRYGILIAHGELCYAENCDATLCWTSFKTNGVRVGARNCNTSSPLGPQFMADASSFQVSWEDINCEHHAAYPAPPIGIYADTVFGLYVRASQGDQAPYGPWGILKTVQGGNIDVGGYICSQSGQNIFEMEACGAVTLRNMYTGAPGGYLVYNRGSNVNCHVEPPFDPDGLMLGSIGGGKVGFPHRTEVNDSTHSHFFERTNAQFAFAGTVFAGNSWSTSSIPDSSINGVVLGDWSATTPPAHNGGGTGSLIAKANTAFTGLSGLVLYPGFGNTTAGLTIAVYDAAATSKWIPAFQFSPSGFAIIMPGGSTAGNLSVVGGHWSFNSKKLQAVADPTAATDAVNLQTLKALAAQKYEWWTTPAPASTSAVFVPRVPGAALTGAAKDSGPRLISAATQMRSLSFVCENAALATDAVVATIQRAPAGSTTFADTPATLTIPAGTTPGTEINWTGSVDLARGDRIVLKLVQAGTTAQASWYAAFTLTCYKAP